jgi:hypothetical protein
MKSIDLLIGVKAEQTLRDAAREASEAAEADEELPELCPVGKKDWVAGRRLSLPIYFGDLGKYRAEIMKNLTALQSHQRIRNENIRLYSVRPPVPVFKDANDDEELREEEVEKKLTSKNPDTEICPICETEIHRYNVQYNAAGKMVGCYLCRGERSFRK